MCAGACFVGVIFSLINSFPQYLVDTAFRYYFLHELLGVEKSSPVNSFLTALLIAGFFISVMRSYTKLTGGVKVSPDELPEVCKGIQGFGTAVGCDDRGRFILDDDGDKIISSADRQMIHNVMRRSMEGLSLHQT